MKTYFNKLILVTAFLFLTIVFGCANQDDPMPALHNPVSIGDSLLASFSVTDSDGNPRTTFKEGENLRFSFIIQNQSNNAVSFLPWDFPLVNKDFFLLKKLDPQENLYQIFGRPFNTVTSTYDLTNQPIPAKTTLFYEIPWQVQLNVTYEMPVYKPQKSDRLRRFYVQTKQVTSPLTKGSYQSSFELNFSGRVVPFSVSFTVE